MKSTALLLFVWILHLPCFGQVAVRPLVAAEFGKPVSVTVEFVAKPNDYHSQNLVSEPFTLKVLSVDGRKLKETVLIEYKLEAEKKEAKKIERVGVVAEFEAYETLYQPITATPWLAEGEQGCDFCLVHVLRLRPVKKKS